MHVTCDLSGVTASGCFRSVCQSGRGAELKRGKVILNFLENIHTKPFLLASQVSVQLWIAERALRGVSSPQEGTKTTHEEPPLGFWCYLGRTTARSQLSPLREVTLGFTTKGSLRSSSGPDLRHWERGERASGAKLRGSCGGHPLAPPPAVASPRNFSGASTNHSLLIRHKRDATQTL